MAEKREGVQIRLWLAEGVYDLLRRRAALRSTSVADEARRLLMAGLARLEDVEHIADRLERLEVFLRQHLEPLAFAAAVDSAWQAAYGRANLRANAKDPAVADRVDRQLREAATERVRMVLRRACDDAESEGNDHEDIDATAPDEAPSPNA